MRSKPTILMAVFNSIDYDGRVQRAASALADAADVIVLSIDSGRVFHAKEYSVRPVTLPHKRDGFPKWVHLYFWLRFWWLAITTRPEIVYAHDFFLSFAGRIAARLAGARFIYDAHELIIPDAYFSESREPSARELFWYKIESAGIRAADVVICANESRATIMGEHYRLAIPPTVVRNIPPRPIELPQTGRAHRECQALRRKDPDTVLCIYQGDVSIDRGLDILVDSFSVLERRFQMIVVGSGPDLGVLQERARQRDLTDRVTFLGRVARNELHDILRLAHIGLITYPTSGANNLYCAPNKIFEYAQAGLPMVMTAQPGLRIYLDKYPIGCSYNSERREIAPQLAAQAIRAVAERHAYFFGNLETFLRDNDWDSEREKLARVVASMLGSATSDATI
jgi:glycosyltransferase involved in cell wall biosynthesis